MPSSRFSGFMVPALAVLIGLFVFAPSAQAQECSTSCTIYSSCNDYCEVCMIFSMDGCAGWQGSTCGESGPGCDGCGVTGSRTVTERYKYGPEDGGAYHCIGRQYWYGYTNRSQYQRYTTEVRTIYYQTYTCNGVTAEQEISRNSQWGECYEFTNGACQSGDIWQTFAINGKECYW